MENKAGVVRSVRVYIDRAAITRVRSFDHVTTEVEFAPIPLAIEVPSLRARAIAEKADGTSQRVRVLAVGSALSSPGPASERQRAIAEEMAAIDAKINAIDDAEETESHVSELLEQYAAVATGTISREWLERTPSFDKWSEAFDHLRGATEKLAVRRALRTLDKSKLIEKRIDLLEEENRLGRAKKMAYSVKVTLEPPPSDLVSLSVELIYVTRAAQWMPIYDARHEGDRLRLTSMALVRQATGEDWTDIELYATTARPPLSEPLPPLVPIAVKSRSRAENKSIVASSEIDPRLAGVASAGADEGAAEVELCAPSRVNVPSSSRPVRVELFDVELPVKTRLETAPMKRPVALLVADVENSSGHILLPGRVNVFRGASYAGQTELGFVSARERFRIPLGSDASVRIKREVKTNPEKEALFGGAVTQSYSRRITVENLSAAPVRLIVRDRLPVSRAAEATVRVAQIDRGAELDEESGVYALEVQLAAREKRELLAEFSVTAPKGFKVAAVADAAS
jgi:hypothetical protein